MRRIDWKRVFQSGVMQLFGATYIMWIERLMAGISHQHVLSYNPIKAFQLSSSIRQELDLSLMYSTISPIKKDINVPIETNKLSLSPNDSMKIENVNVKLLYM